MNERIDWHHSRLASAMEGKTIEEVSLRSQRSDDLVITFTDGSAVRIDVVEAQPFARATGELAVYR